MFVVTKDGKRIDVPSPYGDEDWYPFQQTVGLYDDNTVLKKIWVLDLYECDYFNQKDFAEEFCKSVKYDHEPTEEEILWAMSANGLTRGCTAHVNDGYELDIAGD